ncbi:hypothetical protein B296_00038807, partial [Ensete ventricosum]
KPRLCRKIVKGSQKACRESNYDRINVQPNNGPRSSLSIGPGFERCGGFRWEFAKRFAEGIRKFTGNTPGDHRGEDQKTCRKYVGGYRIG